MSDEPFTRIDYVGALSKFLFTMNDLQKDPQNKIKLSSETISMVKEHVDFMTESSNKLTEFAKIIVDTFDPHEYEPLFEELKTRCFREAEGQFCPDSLEFMLRFLKQEIERIKAERLN